MKKGGENVYRGQEAVWRTGTVKKADGLSVISRGCTDRLNGGCMGDSPKTEPRFGHCIALEACGCLCGGREWGARTLSGPNKDPRKRWDGDQRDDALLTGGLGHGVV